jgi:hypothetical protein
MYDEFGLVHYYYIEEAVDDITKDLYDIDVNVFTVTNTLKGSGGGRGGRSIIMPEAEEEFFEEPVDEIMEEPSDADSQDEELGAVEGAEAADLATDEDSGMAETPAAEPEPEPEPEMPEFIVEEQEEYIIADE